MIDMEDKQTLKIELNSKKIDTYNKLITGLQSLNKYISHIIFWSTAILVLVLLKYANTFPVNLFPKDIVLISILLFMVVMLLLVFSNLVNNISSSTNFLNIGSVMMVIVILSGLFPVIGSEFDSGDMLMVTVWGFYHPLICYYLAYLLSFGIVKFIWVQLTDKRAVQHEIDTKNK